MPGEWRARERADLVEGCQENRPRMSWSGGLVQAVDVEWRDRALVALRVGLEPELDECVPRRGMTHREPSSTGLPPCFL